MGEIISEKYNCRVAFYDDGGTIYTSREDSYIYKNIYFDGFKKWKVFRDFKNYDETKVFKPKFLTIFKYYKLLKYTKEKVEKYGHALNDLKNALADEQVRDLMGEWDFRSSIIKNED